MLRSVKLICTILECYDPKRSLAAEEYRYPNIRISLSMRVAVSFGLNTLMAISRPSYFARYT